MPVWRDPTALEDDNVLNDLWVKLENDVRDDPSFEEITGVDDVTMMAHANATVKAHFAKMNADNNMLALLSPESWKQLYVMGFVMGVRYAQTYPRD